MKPLTAELRDEEVLRDLGSASVQIVHDLKNQLNGLKLYATFLRKRIEKNDRPADELETINKLIAGLERAAGDMTVLVRLGRPLELHRQRADLGALLQEAAGGREVRAGRDRFDGEFDAALIGEALKYVTEAAARGPSGESEALEIHLSRNGQDGAPAALIEWRGVAHEGGGNLFGSFAGGAGLRLALAARIVREHGGEVSQEGKVLRVRLPLSG